MTVIKEWPQKGLIIDLRLDNKAIVDLLLWLILALVLTRNVLVWWMQNFHHFYHGLKFLSGKVNFFGSFFFEIVSEHGLKDWRPHWKDHFVGVNLFGLFNDESNIGVGPWLREIYVVLFTGHFPRIRQKTCQIKGEFIFSDLLTKTKYASDLKLHWIGVFPWLSEIYVMWVLFKIAVDKFDTKKLLASWVPVVTELTVSGTQCYVDGISFTREFKVVKIAWR